MVSLPKSYQHTFQRFRIGRNELGGERDGISLSICVPFPWSSNKESSGGLSFEELDSSIIGDSPSQFYRGLFGSATDTSGDAPNDTTFIAGTSVVVYRKVLELKNARPELQTILIADLAERYSWDDWGFMVFDVEPNRWYELSYRHKISTDSTLTIPTMISANLVYKRVPVTIDIVAIGGDRRNKQTFLEQLETSTELVNDISNRFSGLNNGSILRYHIKPDEFNNDQDIQVRVCNWESSDDDECDTDDDGGDVDNVTN